MMTNLAGQSRDPKQRERDVQVAELVMGWSINRNHGYGSYSMQGFIRDELTKVGHPPGRCSRCPGVGPCQKLHSVPRYTSELPAAWLVIEVMRTKHGGCTFKLFYGWALAPFTATFISGNSDEVWSDYGDTAPAAICRAALKAVAKRELVVNE